MTEEIYWMIAGMAIVTYTPRMLPLVLLNASRIHPRLQGILKNVPYAILGALIFPGVITIDPNHLSFGIIGALVAFIAAYLNWNVILVVLSSILALSLYSFIEK
ncbi:AzlD domain-containing protein [Fictibacillus sp. Mic-4]|uniref:AzlD domain-containing protein n=1 Tax=Fictibacillus TaxID=1329200 RepID=UPI00040C1712|nr:AzlD domain-containing protein [Fictibacillus gelatini]